MLLLQCYRFSSLSKLFVNLNFTKLSSISCCWFDYCNPRSAAAEIDRWVSPRTSINITWAHTPSLLLQAIFIFLEPSRLHVSP